MKGIVATSLHPAIVVNPSKTGATKFLAHARATCNELGAAAPMIYQTTVDSPGQEQARQALADGADIVIAAGGDGTVRQVATAMAHAKIPLGIVPLGTGNLLARNLNLPLLNPQHALEVALGGHTTSVDAGWVKVLEPELGLDGELRETSARPGDQQLFTVIAGVGFDATMIAATDPGLKKRIGWLAYFAGGIKHLFGPRNALTVSFDESDTHDIRARSVLIGNCGRIPALTLLPDARVDDGLLDAALLDARAGLVGWLTLAGAVFSQSIGLPALRSEKHLGRIVHRTAEHLVVKNRQGIEAQVDGDPLGRITALEVWVDPGALTVRCPAPL